MNENEFIEQYKEIMFSPKTKPTWLETYYDYIQQGKIIVGYELKMWLDRLIEDMSNPRYIYDTKEAEIRILFMETACLQSKAPFYNKPLKLLLFQKAFIESCYAFKMAETGLDRFKDILVMLGRKNGKSVLFAGLGTFEVTVGEGGQDICCASNSEQQAKLIWKEIYKMVAKIDQKQKLIHRNLVLIENLKTDTMAFRMSAKSPNQDGFNCNIVFYDESHDSPTDELVMNCLQSMSMRDNPKFFNCTTNGMIEDGYLDKKLKYVRAVINGEIEDETLNAWLYTMDSETEIYQNRLSWYKANPSMGIIKKFDFLEDNINRAKYERSTKIFVNCKDFNIKQNSGESWLMPEDYSYEQENFKLEDFRNSYCFAAVDLSATTDLSCLKLLFQKPNSPNKYIYTKYFIPESKLDNADDKAAGAKYREWATKGYLDIHEGNEVNMVAIAQFCYQLYKDYGIKIYKLGYDVRFAVGFLSELEKYGYGNKKDETCELINQSKYVMSTPIKVVEADLKSQLIHGITEMDRWCFSNCGIKVDDEGRVMLIKISQPARIDGAVTQAILQAIYSRYKADYVNYINGNQ